MNIITISRNELSQFFAKGNTSVPCNCTGRRMQWYPLWPTSDVLGTNFLAGHLMARGIKVRIENNYLYGYGRCQNLKAVTGKYLAEVRRINEID